MAFSTQKEFFNVPFMNETVDYECRRSCVQLKSYNSTNDDRAWAMNETDRSRYLTDLVTCRTPASSSRPGDSGRGDSVYSSTRGAGERGRRGPVDSRGMHPQDSLIEATNVTLDKVQALLQDKRSLQQRLQKSEECVKTTKAEYERIKEILNRKFDRSDFNNLYNRIQKMSACGSFSKNDENELMKFGKKMEDLSKAYEISQAENSYLKRLVEKLSRRCDMEKIPVEPETCRDIPYLQNEVNKLRKELMALRNMEDNKMNMNDNVMDPNIDVNNLNTIIKERNALRDRLRSMQDIEKQVGELRKRLTEASQVSNNLTSKLDNKSQYICDLENDMREMQSHYEDRVEQRNCKMECYKRELEKLQKELCSAKLEAQKLPCLKACIARLEDTIKQKDRKLCDYDTQFKQLMCVINELRESGATSGGGCPQVRLDCQTQTACDEYIDDLTFYTRATLEHIQKELQKRGIKATDIGPSKSEECCKEVNRLRKIICQLQNDKQHLGHSLMDRNKCFDNLTSRIDDLCKQCDQNALDSENAKRNLDNAFCLVDDIANLQDQNQQLVNITDNLSKKEIDDLLNDLQSRLKDCLEVKEDLKIAMRRKGLDPDSELRAIEESRLRGSLPPRDPVDMGPLLSGISGAPGIDPVTGKPIPGAVAGTPGALLIDPATGQPMIDPATGKPIPAAAAGAPGALLIDPATGQPMIDPVTGKPIPAAAAGAPGAPMIDPATGQPIPGAVARAPGAPLIDPTTGKPIPGAVAGAPGALLIDPATGKPMIDPATGKPIPATAAGVSGAPVIDPATGKPIPGAVAGAPGAPVIDPATGKPIPGAAAGGPGAPVIDPATGKPIPGAVAGGPGSPVIDPATGKPIPGAVAGSPGAPVIDPATGKPIPGAAAGVPGIDPATGKPIPGAAAGSPGAPVIDPKTGKPIPGAVAGGPGAPVIDPATGKPIPGAVAGAPGAPVIDPATGKPIPGAVAGAPGAPVIDPATGKPIPGAVAGAPGAPVIDPATGKPIPGAAAGVPGIDPATGKPIPGAAAGSPGAPVVDPKTGKPIPGVVAGGPGAPVIDPATGKPTPGAVAGGPGAPVIDPATGKSIPGAVAGGPGAPAIDPAAGKPIPGAVAGGAGAPVIDPATGKPIPGAAAGGPGAPRIDPATGKRISGAATGGPGAARIDPAAGRAIPGTVAGRPGTPGAGKQTTGGTAGRPGTPVIDPTTGEPIAEAFDGAFDGNYQATGRTTTGKMAKTATGKPSGPIRGSKSGGDGSVGEYSDFLKKNATNMGFNLQAGSSLENELRKILDAFVDECRFCLCQTKVPKSKFYAICHKILHEGIMNICFKDIAYIHKKIFYASEKLFPGCLLKIILTEYVEVAEERKKCCQCKSLLCCDSSQELLKEKVRKLEVEVESARNYLRSIRSQHSGIPNECTSEEDDNKGYTFRPQKPKCSPKITNRQLRSIKATIAKCSQNMKR